MRIINKKYKILEKIGSGSFGNIYKAEHIKTNEKVAVKIEPLTSNGIMLLNETKIYNFLNTNNHIPDIKWFGKDNENYYMVINLLGESLQNLLTRLGHFSLTLTLKIGIKILNILETIHNSGFIHRDLKPDNFLFKLDDFSHLYLIDFGLCKSYIKNGEHIFMKNKSGIIGSMTYASIHSHQCVELSRRDDIESLCYMLFYFYNGELNWRNEKNEMVILNKKYNIINDNTQPSILLKILKHVRNMKFEEKPNYSYINKIMRDKIELLIK